MPYYQHAPKQVVAPTNEIVRVECEKTGTVYFEHVRTKERTWTKSEVERQK